MTGTQRIGWDPVTRNIRSWVFDSEGGFGEGVWTREGNKWIVKKTGVTGDGKIASATNIISQVSKHRMTWESRSHRGRKKDARHRRNRHYPQTTRTHVTARGETTSAKSHLCLSKAKYQ